MRQQYTPRREGWEELANAVVERAALDYRIARRALAKPDPPPDADAETVSKCMMRKIHARRRIREVEQFFTSDWFQEFTDADGGAILARLQQERVRTRRGVTNVDRLRARTDAEGQSGTITTARHERAYRFADGKADALRSAGNQKNGEL